MNLPKFIITMDGVFRLGMVNQHKIILDRSSYDFGKPKWHLLETLKVPSTYRGMRLVYQYDDDFHDDFNVSEELNIAYYD